jgi:hypothetical protein
VGLRQCTSQGHCLSVFRSFNFWNATEHWTLGFFSLPDRQLMLLSFSEPGCRFIFLFFFGLNMISLSCWCDAVFVSMYVLLYNLPLASVLACTDCVCMLLLCC